MANAPPYPMFLDMVQRPVLIVGAGAVALRKTRGLIESGARITLVSPKFHKGFDEFADVERIEAPYAATHMARKLWRLVFAATDFREVNAQVLKHATAAGIFCCRCDAFEEGDFSSGAMQRLGTSQKDGRGRRAIADLGGVTLVVSTSGASPLLSARICRQAAAAVDPVLPELTNLLEVWRVQAKTEVPDPVMRRALLQRLAGEQMEDTLRTHGEAAARKLHDQWVKAILSGNLGALPPLDSSARGSANRADVDEIAIDPPPAYSDPSRAAKHAD